VIFWADRCCYLSRIPDPINRNSLIELQADTKQCSAGRSKVTSSLATMSVLAPIICDNGTGYSKVGYVFN
jgi:hypothetical protein